MSRVESTERCRTTSTSLSLSLSGTLINRPDQWDDWDPITPRIRDVVNGSDNL